MRTPIALWEATRPRMFPVWLSSGLVPAVVALRDGIFDPFVFVLETLLCYFLLTLSCWADELGDLDHGVDNDRRLGPIRPLQRGDLSRRTMMFACAVLAFACVVDGVALLARSFSLNPGPFAVALALVVAGFALVALAFAYTMGERPYGYRGLGDVVAFACFGPVACIAGYWMYAHVVNWAVSLPAAAVGLLLAATINLQNVRDMENDVACGKMTLAGKLGRRGAVTYQLALVGVSCVCYLVFFPASGLLEPWRVAVLAASFAPLLSHCVRFWRMVRTEEDPALLDGLMWPLTRGMLVVCLTFCAAALL